MEQKHVLLSALSAGIGLGVGIGKWVGLGSDSESNELSEDQIVMELLNLVIDGKNSDVTFDEFPYYLSERNKILLTNAGYVHLRQHHLSKRRTNLSPISRTILLSAPSEVYNQKLATALAHCFGSKLLFLDIAFFSMQMTNKYGCCKKEPYLERSISKATLECVSGLFGSLSILPSSGATRAPLKCTSRFCFDEKRFLDSLYKVLVSISEAGSIILYIKSVEIFLKSPRMYSLFQKLLKKLSGSLLILASRIYDSKDDKNCIEVDEKLTMLFPSNIEIKPPKDETHLKIWKAELENATNSNLCDDSLVHIIEVLAKNDINCNDLNSLRQTRIILLGNHIEEIVESAIFRHLMDVKDPAYQNGKLIIPANSLYRVLYQFLECEQKTTKESEQEVPPDNDHEKLMRQYVTPANMLSVSFSDIGASDDVKESLQEAVMLPLRRPDLFQGDLLEPCKGVLLFGPPGTGKTMLAKAIANETGANFINVSTSSLASQYFGESEKNVRALFSLAAKVEPAIIFIDEVDSMLGRRGSESETMRRIKNEFMFHWDDLLSEYDEKILVLAATNMPFDLDEAIIRRFQRRIMVGIPSAETREMILKNLLAKENHKDIDFKELSTMTEGYSGSDLKNLCMTAAYYPVKELIQQEKEKQMKKKEVEISKDASNATKEDEVIPLRPLNMEDMRQAKNKVAASFSEDETIMKRLKEWNDLYGEGGSRKKETQPSYFI